MLCMESLREHLLCAQNEDYARNCPNATSTNPALGSQHQHPYADVIPVLKATVWRLGLLLV